MDDAAPFQHVSAIGEREHQVEIMLDDDERHFAAQFIEGLEQFFDHGRRQTLERLVEQQHGVLNGA